MAKTIHIPLSRGYDIIIEPGILNSVGMLTRGLFTEAAAVAVVTDDNVKELYLERVMRSLSAFGFTVLPYSIPPGEASKTPEVYFNLLNWLADSRLSRYDIIIALGGGVAGDLAGFTAATYLRGVAYIQIPTTLLAMVDSSVGGKTGINLNSGKNLAGAFHQPSLVLCDTTVLNTLPGHIYNDGLAEVIKYGFLGSPDIIEQLLAEDFKSQIDSIIAACVKMKRDITAKDEFDRGERKLLNFGHTVGHAVELLSEYKIPHGAAVGIGMAVMTRASFKKNLCPPENLEVLEKLLTLFSLPSRTDYSAGELFEAALSDKKRHDGNIDIIVPTGFGICELKKIPAESLLEWIEMGCV